MDIISHGLYGSIAFGRENRRNFLLAFFFGIAPDLFSFGLYTIGTWTGFFDHPDWRSGQHPDPSQIPLFVHTLYNYTHSLVIFLIVFGLVSAIRKRPWWIMGGWGLHILVDIPTHSDAFFPTPFLWPISSYHVNGVSWGHPSVFFPNVVLIVILYTWFYFFKKRKRASLEREAS
ncbi:MAG: hypothetical protein ABI747_01425 [Candidatus Moraniibacteriota bacterium]